MRRLLVLAVLFLALLHGCAAEREADEGSTAAAAPADVEEAPMEVKERRALYAAIEGFVGKGWNGSGLFPDPCGQTPIQGVSCDLFNGLWYPTVVSIGPVLDNSLQCAPDAKFSPQLFELRRLKSLTFYACFPATNPTSIPANNWEKLAGSLETLEFRTNPGLTGAIPASLGRLAGLQSLVLVENNVTGVVPAELGGLAKLRRLVLSGNGLSGPVPATLGGLKGLLKMDLSSNHLEGSIPPELAGLDTLTLLDLRNNSLTGGLPEFVQGMASLQDLLLSNNSLGGSLMRSGWEKLASLATLDLSNAGLVGSIPESMGAMARLRFLALDHNRLSARRLAGVLTFVDMAPRNDAREGEKGAFELPCFEKATAMSFDLGFLSLALPPSGVFSRLTDLSLDGVQLHGPCGIGEVASSSRCPSLRRLTICNAQGLGNFTIHSESLLEIQLKKSCGLQQLTIVVPALKKLTLFFCFSIDLNPSQQVADIAAPQLVSLEWRDAYDPSSVQFGKMAHLEWLGTAFFLVYGPDGYAHNRDCVMLLRHFEVVHTLSLVLAYMSEDIEDLGEPHYLMEDMTRLPNITFLTLLLIPNGHFFGASSFHVLRMCTGLRKLMLIFHTHLDLEVETACASGCICDQPPNWKTEELVLNRLQEVEITYLRGTEHDFALVKRLFTWATALQTMTITFHRSITESMAKEFCQKILGFSKPGICVEFYVYHFLWKKVLYVPEN